MYKKLTVFLLSTMLTVSALASAQNKDPLEGFNRAMFTFNDGLDHLILKPVSQAYLDVMPKPVVRGVSNFYDNLSTIPTIGNDLFQTNFHQAVNDTSRLLINSTLGIFGLFDVASLIGIPANHEDMGLTFAHWGWTTSTYVVLPFFGPRTVRDTAGMPFDYFMSVYHYIDDVSLRDKLFVMGVINTRANLLQMQDVISQAALDPYVFQRNAYLQRRAYLIKRNNKLDDKDYATLDNAWSSGKTAKNPPPALPSKSITI